MYNGGPDWSETAWIAVASVDVAVVVVDVAAVVVAVGDVVDVDDVDAVVAVGEAIANGPGASVADFVMFNSVIPQKASSSGSKSILLEFSGAKKPLSVRDSSLCLFLGRDPCEECPDVAMLLMVGTGSQGGDCDDGPPASCKLAVMSSESECVLRWDRLLVSRGSWTFDVSRVSLTRAIDEDADGALLAGDDGNLGNVAAPLVTDDAESRVEMPGTRDSLNEIVGMVDTGHGGGGAMTRVPVVAILGPGRRGEGDTVARDLGAE